jgi:hypothetical protein
MNPELPKKEKKRSELKLMLRGQYISKRNLNLTKKQCACLAGATFLGSLKKSEDTYLCRTHGDVLHFHTEQFSSATRHSYSSSIKYEEEEDDASRSKFKRWEEPGLF